jgi:NADH-quinone oxidoreductase subunit G
VLSGLKIKKVYYWKNNESTFDSFDGLLIRGDKNPNTKGLLKALDKAKLTLGSISEFDKLLASGQVKAAVVAGPENQAVYPDLASKVEALNLVLSGQQVDHQQ